MELYIKTLCQLLQSQVKGKLELKVDFDNCTQVQLGVNKNINTQSMYKFVKPPRKQIVKPPFVDLEVTTWSKDSHALYDYEAGDSRFFTENFQINKNAKIYRHITSMKTLIVYDDDKKQPAMENIYIASIFVDPNTKAFWIQSADSSGVQPHPFIRQQHPDIFRNAYVVVGDFEKDPGNEGFPLDAGNYIKLGRVQYLVIEVMDVKGLRTLKETSHLQLNQGIYQVPQQNMLGSCKICLCEQASEEDPLINPCSCKGSCELVHVGCLRNWINSKVKKEVNGIALSYNFSKFQCQICKTLLPKTVELKGGVGLEMITFEKPTRPYIVLQSVTDKHERRQELKQRNLHVVSPDEKVPVRLGRGHQCEIRITDISVSRTHSQIRLENGKFYVKDLKSKFGTLVKFREQFELTDRVRVQYGRTCFDFLLNEEEKTQKQLIEQQYANRPIFYTRAQLRERGELSDEEDQF